MSIRSGPAQQAPASRCAQNPERAFTSPGSGLPGLLRTQGVALRSNEGCDDGPIARSLTLENAMRNFEISFPELAFVAATRGMAGAGIGLLVGEQLPPQIRRTLGWTLLAVGALSTVPIAFEVFGRRNARRALE